MIHTNRKIISNKRMTLIFNENSFIQGVVALCTKLNDILFQGAEELNRAVKSMKDTNSLLPQLRTFLTFLDSTLEAETNFKVMHLKY